MKLINLKTILTTIVIVGCVGAGVYLLNPSLIKNCGSISKVIIHDGVVGGKSGTYTNITGLASEFTNVSVYANGLLTSYKINGVEQ